LKKPLGVVRQSCSRGLGLGAFPGLFLEKTKQQCYQICFGGLGTFIILSSFIRPNFLLINDKISIYRLSPINDESSSLVSLPHMDVPPPAISTIIHAIFQLVKCQMQS